MFKKALFLLASLISMSWLAVAQPRTVTGTITSAEDGLPAIGASVIVKGAESVGVVTGDDGRFVLSGIPSGATTLEISCIGMKTVEVPIRSVIEVALAPDEEFLEEAVITIAYGAAKRSSLTGAISSVSAEKLETRPTSSVTAALEGTVSGVQINSTYGAPGSSPSIRIRGIGTVNGSSSPLYVIDGVPFDGNISDLNQADIENLSVLKDAASAALYGNRASNGVILITTKKGSAGRLSVNLDIKQGTYSRGIKEYSRVSPRDFMNIEWEGLKNTRISAGSTPEAAAAYASANLIDDWLGLNIWNASKDALFDQNGKLKSDLSMLGTYGEDLDWYDAAIRNGYRQEYNLSASGGAEKSDFYFSVGYLDENGYVSDSGYSRLSARTAVNVRPANWFKTGFTLSGSHQNSDRTNGDSDGSFTNVFRYARYISPIYPVHLHDVNTGEYLLDKYGNKRYDGGSYVDANGIVQPTRNQNPDRHVIWENELNSDKTVRNVLEGVGYFDIYFLKDFTFTVTGNINVRNSSNTTYNNAEIGDGKGNGGRGSRNDYLYKKYTFQQQLRWVKQFGDHGVNALIGHENYSYNRDYLHGYKTSEIIPGSTAFINFTSITSLDSYADNYKTESYLGRARYNYKERYNVEASFRRDGSSRFAPGKRWGNFWSVGANWMISSEDFMRNVKWVNSLKLRADYGQVGNDAGAGFYSYMLLYELTQNANKGALYLSQLPNVDLKWETGESWGVAVEARLFNRWNLNVEYFDKTNKDLIFNVYNPLSAGGTSTGSAISTVTKNIGSITNKGVEIETDIDVYRSRDWSVNVNANATFLRNKVTKLPEQNKDGIISGMHKIVEGKDRYAYYLYTWEGVDQLTGRSVYKFNDEDYYITSDNTANGEVLYGKKTSENGVRNTLMSAANYEIVNGTPYVFKTTYAKREFHGTSIPKVYGSFGFNVGWKSLNLSSVFTYSLGGKTYDGVYSDLMSLSANPTNLHTDIMNSWHGVPDGMTETSADRINPNGIPMVNATLNTDNNAGTSSRWLVSSNYLVVKNVALSYRLPKAWAEKASLSGISVSAACENLFTFTARQGMNPQQAFDGSQYNYLVTPRVLTFAVSLKF